jgi:phenylpropionate dioxygenase-like ring-hydroxylating dioxygenase large terminal subunit
MIGRTKVEQYIRNAWYVAAWSSEVSNSFFTRRILDEPVLMYRMSDGTPVALLDRCAHKLVPLSMGRLVGDRVQCGYHGLEYDCSGKCVRVPGQERIPPQAKVRSFPLEERYNALWIWMGEPDLADPALIIDIERFGKPGWAVIDGQYQCHRTSFINIAENLVDPAHTTYVHKGTIGNPAASDVTVEVQTGKNNQGLDYVLAYRWITNAEAPPIDKRLGGFTGLTDRCQYYNFFPPAVSRVDVVTMNAGQEHTEENKDSGLRAFSYKFLTPETVNRTHFFWMHVRNFRLDEDVSALIEGMNATFEEDNVISSAMQLEQEATGDLQYAWIQIDAAPARLRKMIEKMIADEQMAKPAPALS